MSQILSPNTLSRVAPAEAGSRLARRRSCSSYQEEDEFSGSPATGGQTALSASTTVTSSCGTASNNNNNLNAGNAIAQVMKRSQWKINTSLESKRARYDTICSICFREPTRRNPLITPCLCLGERARQHKSCIEDWIEETGAASCPFCFVRYEYSRKRKSFWSYLKDCELERDFVVSLTAFALSLYLFLVGLSVCYHYAIGADYFGGRPTKCERRPPGGCHTDEDLGAGWSRVVAWRAELHADKALSWRSVALFCFACTTSVLLFIGLVSTLVRLLFRLCVGYSLWSGSHFSVSVQPYALAGSFDRRAAG